jgi:hypothetical protein
MHTLHTTPAYIVQSRPRGESNRSYRLLTRDYGLVLASAQGVRELRNRNRYALQVGTHATVTLVRGREGWRITTASAEQGTVPAALRRLLDVTGRIVPFEDTTTDVYSVLSPYLALPDEQVDESIETIAVLALTYALGYVTPVDDPVVRHFVCSDVPVATLVGEYPTHKKHLVRIANSALQSALE